MIKIEIRLVPILWPKSSWGIQDDPNEKPKVAGKKDICTTFSFCRVGPIRGHDGRMLYAIFEFPVAHTLSEWNTVLMWLNDAHAKPILYREDFEIIADSM